MPWTRQSPAEVDFLFASQRAVDPFGVRLHTLFAAAYVFLAGWPTTFVDWAGLCLLICFGIRMITHHRILGPLWWDGVTRAVAVWAAWIALSMVWSAGTAKTWVGDAGSLRYAIAVPLLYPVMDRRPLLMAALALGLVCGEVSQAAHWIGLHWDVAWLTWNRDPQRISGWWDPVVGGSLLCGLLGLSCGVAIPGDERRAGAARWAARAMIPVTLLAIIATGTRGAWIGAAGVLGLAGAVFLLCEATKSRAGRWRAGAAVVAAIGLVVAAVWFAPAAARSRFERGVSEVRSALRGEDFTSDTGQRLAMWVWGARCVEHSPIIGVGAGGYRPWCVKQVSDRAAEEGLKRAVALPAPHAHAHSWFIHTAATLGIVGVGILLWMLFSAVRGNLLRVRTEALRPSPGERLAVPLALAGLAFAGVFDTIHVNQQTANLLYILLALSVPMRPSALGRAAPTHG